MSILLLIQPHSLNFWRLESTMLRYPAKIIMNINDIIITFILYSNDSYPTNVSFYF